MTYNGATITYGSITAPSGIEVPGWVITIGSRTTIAASRELAERFIDGLNNRKQPEIWITEKKPEKGQNKAHKAH